MGKGVALVTAIILLIVFALVANGILDPADESISGGEEGSSLASGNSVSATHAFKDGIHRFSGVFLLPHSCFSVDQTGMNQGAFIDIRFTVVDMKGRVSPCTNITTRYPFTMLVEAPETFSPRFFINGEEVPSRLRKTSWQSAAGTLIDTNVTAPSLF